MRRQSRNLRESLLRKNRGRLLMELLEDRNLLSCGPEGTVLEDFDDPYLSEYQTLIRYYPSALQDPGLGCEGGGGLFDYDGDDWLVRDIGSPIVSQGDTISAWVYMGGGTSGRAYVGFGSRMPNVDAGLGMVSGGTLSVALAANTNQFQIQQHRGYKFTGSNLVVLGTTSFSYTMEAWYRVEIAWGVGGGISATLFNDVGDALVATSGTQTAGHPFTNGGLAFRGFGADAYYLFDSVVRMDPGNGPGPLGTRPPVQPNYVPAIDLHRGNNPTLAGLPAPFGYESTPWTDRDITLANISGYTQLSCSVGGCDGGAYEGYVGVSFSNTSQNLGPHAVPWGPSLIGHFSNDTPMNSPQFTMYFYVLDPGGETYQIGESGMKAFWSSTWGRDFQHIAPARFPGGGDQDTYGSGHNSDRRSFTSIAALNTTTGERYDYDEMGTRNLHGIYQLSSRSFPGPFENLLRVDAYEIDPREHPGRRYFAAANVWVVGDNNTANNSRWQELRVTPAAGANRYTLATIGGQQLDVCRIPGMPQIGRCLSDGPAPGGSSGGPLVDGGLVAVSALLARPAADFVVPVLTSGQMPLREAAPVDQLFGADRLSEEREVYPATIDPEEAGGAVGFELDQGGFRIANWFGDM